MTKRYCASCRNGEIRCAADYRVRGKVWGRDRMVPYNAYLCKEHLEMLSDDDAMLDVVEYVSQEAKDTYAKQLVDEHTGYETIKQFLAQNHPTLMKFQGAAWLRKYFFERTGRKAFC